MIRDKNTGLYFRGKGVNRWGKYFNQASIYRIKGTAEHTIKEIALHGEKAEIVPIKITEPAADVEEVKHGFWMPQILLGERVWDCSECKTIGSPHWKRCPVCETKMDGGKENVQSKGRA